MTTFKPVPFPATWKRELDMIPELPTSDVGAIRTLAAVLHSMEALQDLMTAKGMRTHELDFLQRSCLYFFAHTYHIGRAAYELVRQGYGVAGLMLVRTILETDIDLAYLWKCKEINGEDTELMAWAEFHEWERGNLARIWRQVQAAAKAKNKDLPALVTPEQADAFEAEADHYKARYGRNHWSANGYRTVFDRARAVDQVGGPPNFFFQEDYAAVYKYTSRFVHPNLWAANAYISESEGRIVVDFGPNRKEVGTAAAMAARFLIAMLHTVNEILGLKLDLDAQLAESTRGAGIRELG